MSHPCEKTASTATEVPGSLHFAHVPAPSRPGPQDDLFVVFSLLTTQLALANYFCPAEAPPQGMAAMMAAGVPCDEMDASQPTLCHQHAADPGQVVQAAQVLSPSLPAVIQVLVIRPVLFADAVAIPRASTPEASLHPIRSFSPRSDFASDLSVD